MHRLAACFAPGQQDLSAVLTQMLTACRAATPLAQQAGAGVALASSLAVHEAHAVAVAVTGRPRFAAELAGLSPAQAVWQLWRTHGRDAPRHIHGNFALAVVDVAEQGVFLALDRIGAERLAYATPAGALVCASQADMVAAHPAVGSTLDAQGLFNYIYFFQVPAPGSVYRGVRKLLPAQWLHWRQGQVETGFYWAIAYQDAARHDFDAQARRFMALLHDGVRRARGGDEVAAFLSGGTDSSTVSGLIKQQAGRARTYSIGFDAGGFDEMAYARLAARHFGLDAREYYLQQDDVLAAIPLIARHYDEPFANESAVPTYFCARLAAADGHTVMLAGDGGDELFGGNERYAKQKVFERYQQVPALLRRGLIEPLLHLPGLTTLALARKAQSYVRQANMPMPQRMESYNFIYRQPLAEMFVPEFLAQVDASQPAAWLEEVYQRAASTSTINRMLHLDMKFTLADNDLRKVGGMTEAAGIEVRYPLLDDELVEFSATVPPDWKVRGQYLRWFFKQALVGFLPAEIIHKRKHGFGLPFGLWARDYAPLRERVEARFAAFKRRGILQPAYVEHLRAAHMSGHATYFGRMVWLILSLEEWLDARGL